MACHSYRFRCIFTRNILSIDKKTGMFLQLWIGKPIDLQVAEVELSGDATGITANGHSSRMLLGCRQCCRNSCNLFCEQFRDNPLVEWETLTQPVIQGSIVLPLPSLFCAFSTDKQYRRIYEKDYPSCICNLERPMGRNKSTKNLWNPRAFSVEISFSPSHI